MVNFRICGPKLSLCGALLSVWGILQLSVMALAFYYNSVAFVEDLKLPKEFYHEADNLRDDITKTSGKVAESCAVAVALYVVTLCFSLHQLWMNNHLTPATTYVRHVDMDMEEYT